MNDELKPYKPVLKLLVVKGLVFIIFWQGVLLSVLAYFEVLKPTQYWTIERKYSVHCFENMIADRLADVMTGIDAIAITFEMIIFAILDIYAFPYTPYRAPHPDDRIVTSRWKAMLDVIDLRDIFREMGSNTVYFAATVQKKHRLLDRTDDMEKALGRTRADEKDGPIDSQRDVADDDEAVDLEKELQRIKSMETPPRHKKKVFATAAAADDQEITEDERSRMLSSWSPPSVSTPAMSFGDVRFPSNSTMAGDAVYHRAYSDPFAKPSRGLAIDQDAEATRALLSRDSLDDYARDHDAHRPIQQHARQQLRSKKEGKRPREVVEESKGSWLRKLRKKDSHGSPQTDSATPRSAAAARDVPLAQPTHVTLPPSMFPSANSPVEAVIRQPATRIPSYPARPVAVARHSMESDRTAARTSLDRQTTSARTASRSTRRHSTSSSNQWPSPQAVFAAPSLIVPSGPRHPDAATSRRGPPPVDYSSAQAYTELPARRELRRQTFDVARPEHIMKWAGTAQQHQQHKPAFIFEEI